MLDQYFNICSTRFKSPKYLLKHVKVIDIFHLLYLPYPLFLLKKLGNWSVFFCTETSNTFKGCSLWIYFASFNLCGHLQSSKVLRILHRDLLLRRRVSQEEVKLPWCKLNIFANFFFLSNIPT